MTRHIDWHNLEPMLRQPPRAYLAGLDADGLELVQVTIRYDAERFWVRDRPELDHWDRSPVRLTIDDGLYWFELRAVTLRGALTEPDAEGWRELQPTAISAWDYGTLREGDDAPE